MLFDVSAVARRSIFQPRQDLGTVETVLATEAVRRQAIANDQLGHRPHVHFEHLGDVLSSEYFSRRFFVIGELFTHHRSNDLANVVRRHDQHCTHVQ